VTVIVATLGANSSVVSPNRVMSSEFEYVAELNCSVGTVSLSTIVSTAVFGVPSTAGADGLVIARLTVSLP
jgi:hypothetical protein